MKKLSCFILLLLVVCPAVFAQKPVIGAVSKKLASSGVKAAEKDLLELEKRFAKLRGFRSCKDLQRVSFLLLKRFPASPQRDELDALFRSGRYAQAQSLVHGWLTGEELALSESSPTKDISSRRDLNQQFLKFDLYDGADLQQAVAFLNGAVQEKLLTQNEYRNILWSLSKLDFSNARNILARNDKAFLYQRISTVQHNKNLTVLSQMYKWNDLHPEQMLLPAPEETVRREAVRRVMGSVYGGPQQPLEVYKQHYDKLFPWQQQEISQRIDQMEKTLSSRLAQLSVKRKKEGVRSGFGQSFKAFAEGEAFISWKTIKILYSPYVSAGARREAEQALGENVSAAEKYQAGLALYDHYASNLAKGIMAGGETHARVLSVLEELKTYLLQTRQWPQEGSALYSKLRTLQDNPDFPAANLLVRRLQQQQESLPEKGLYARLLDYISRYGKYPPSSSSLYSVSNYYKTIPGPYREKFQELFQKYHRNKPK